MLPAIAIALTTAFALSLVLTFVVRAVGRRRALLDSAGAAGHAKVLRGVPNIGGIAIFWSFAIPIVLALAAIWAAPALIVSLAPAVETHLAGIRSQSGLALGLLGCSLVLHTMGLIDDRSALGPWLKFAVQFAVASVIVVLFDVRVLTLLDANVGGPWLSSVVTVLWIVTITNAMNFMDNMDGLSAGVAITVAAGLILSALAAGQWFVATTLATLIGSLAGFLAFNFPFTERRTATIFMGDGGSLVIGFLLAFLAVRVTYVTAPLPGLADQTWLSTPGSLAMLMPLCALAVPLYDLVSVSLIRLSQGRSPLVGDRQHFSHRLRAAGLSVRRTVLVICGCTAITGITGILLAWATMWQAALAVLQVLLVLAMIALYEHGRGWKNPSDGSRP